LASASLAGSAVSTGGAEHCWSSGGVSRFCEAAFPAGIILGARIWESQFFSSAMAVVSRITAAALVPALSLSTCSACAVKSSWRPQNLSIQQHHCSGAPSLSSTSSAAQPLRQSQRRHATWRVERLACQASVSLGGPSSEAEKEIPAGSKIRVVGKLIVYHVPKVKELNLEGMEGEVKDVVSNYKGTTISANLPLKCEFVTEVEGKSVKFFAHLKSDEVETI
jgi:hypothetical protein